MMLIQFWLGNQYIADTISFARLILLIVPAQRQSAPRSTPSWKRMVSSAPPTVSSTCRPWSRWHCSPILAFTGLLTPHAAAICYSGFAVPIFFYLSYQAWRILRPTWSFSKELRTSLLRFGIRFYGVDILGVASRLHRTSSSWCSSCNPATWAIMPSP